MERLMEKLGRFFDQGFQIAVLDLKKGKRWISDHSRKCIPYLKAVNAKGHHILIQPREQPPYLPADDICPALLRRHHQYDGK